jgi:hypothetical protein
VWERSAATHAELVRSPGASVITRSRRASLYTSARFGVPRC